ncbi:MAG: hypothetical protein L6R39_000517 [Caloplaca ligustica]|nr:MAG: hypothetical protein L6R39_000517 [Caloplaca ligustica]
MGRTEQRVAKSTHSIAKATRAKRAKETLNKTIPALLTTYPRARRGIELTDHIKPDPTPKDERIPLRQDLKIRILATDTITAAINVESETSTTSTGTGRRRKEAPPKIALLNMASPLRPGGGFLTGANSQEEFLCMRTTLLPSLHEEFYRLPELSLVYTSDVLVFRDGEGHDLPKSDRFFVDVVSAAMLRYPDVTNRIQNLGSAPGGPAKQLVYTNNKDREIALAKMRLVLDICAERHVDKVILGAWGCGAFANPVHEIARLWRKALFPDEGRKKNPRKLNKGMDVANLREAIFAIPDKNMASVFADCFADRLFHELAAHAEPSGLEDRTADEDVAGDPALRELEVKIDEISRNLEDVKTEALKGRLEATLVELRKQLEREKIDEDHPALQENISSESVGRATSAHAPHMGGQSKMTSGQKR